MAAMMGHGGDGGDKPPHPFGGDFGVHQIDAVPPRRRGMAVNKKMHRLYEANGRQPLKIIFDRNTFVPIGDVYECFIREVGSYIWRDIALDKNTWKEVPEDDRNGMFTYLSRYRGRKNIAKSKFIDMLEGAEAARARPPVGMDSTRWSATIDHFLTDTHCKRSSVNKECRKKQVVKNRGGTCSYSSASFKNNLNKLEVFHRAHVNKQGEFVDPLVEEQYDVDVNAFLQNPVFVTALGDIIRSFSKQVDNATNNDEENDDGDND
ncbi:unnamed protein product [Lactuca saligna]|uniref:Uncharacterized protein n=1 Tax=Lactuca saligna TaxID=75948 RepID=A0AA35Z3E9_LACSI|nr:unnamed protein product [Lactuca saligna]